MLFHSVRLRSFENLVRIWDYPSDSGKDGKDKMHRFIWQPALSPAYVKQLMWSELGDYMQNLWRKRRARKRKFKKVPERCCKGKKDERRCIRKLRQMLMEELDLSRRILG